LIEYLPDNGDESYLYVEIDKNSRRDTSAVKNEIASIFKEYFNISNLQLNQTISIKTLSQSILDVDGVVTFSTRRGNLTSNLLQLLVYNPVYPNDDYTFTEQDINLKYFQFPYFKDLLNISNRIEVTRQE